MRTNLILFQFPEKIDNIVTGHGSLRMFFCPDMPTPQKEENMNKRALIVSCIAFMIFLTAYIIPVFAWDITPTDDTSDVIGIEALPPTCYIAETCPGTPVSTVSDSISGAENVYWMVHGSNDVKYKKVKFTIKFRTDNPKNAFLKEQVQVFSFPSSIIADVCTPFSVPSGAGRPIYGDAKLIVKATRPNGAVKKCEWPFSVAPASPPP